MPYKREVRPQVLGGLLDAVLRAGFVMQEAKFERGFGLGLVHLRLFIAQVEDVH